MNFSQSLYSTLESSRRLQVAVVSSRPSEDTYQIKLRYISANATSKHKDYDIYCELINIMACRWQRF